MIIKFNLFYIKLQILCFYRSTDEQGLCIPVFKIFSKQDRTAGGCISRLCNLAKKCHYIIFYVYLLFIRGISYLSDILWHSVVTIIFCIFFCCRLVIYNLYHDNTPHSFIYFRSIESSLF